MKTFLVILALQGFSNFSTSNRIGIWPGITLAKFAIQWLWHLFGITILSANVLMIMAMVVLNNWTVFPFLWSLSQTCSFYYLGQLETQIAFITWFWLAGNDMINYSYYFSLAMGLWVWGPVRPSKEESFVGAQNSVENGQNSSIKKKKKKNRPGLSKDKYFKGCDL